jgi:flagellar basal body-associated protein FliL
MVMQPVENPYQFITDTSHKPKKPLLPGGNSKQGRIIIVAVGLIVLLIVAAVIMGLISSAGNAGKNELVKAAQQQTELIRISKIGIDKARDPATKNLAVTTNLSLQSDQAALLANVKVSTKELTLSRSTKTDVSLTTAEQSNRFDEVFAQTIQTELAQYRATLKSAYDKSSSTKLKNSLNELYAHAALLTSKE